jgi:hypothetical protein
MLHLPKSPTCPSHALQEEMPGSEPGRSQGMSAARAAPLLMWTHRPMRAPEAPANRLPHRSRSMFAGKALLPQIRSNML